MEYLGESGFVTSFLLKPLAAGREPSMSLRLLVVRNGELDTAGRGKDWPMSDFARVLSLSLFRS